LQPAFTVSFSAHFSTLKMEAICYSQTPLDSEQTTLCYIPEDGTLQNYRCENLKSYNVFRVSLNQGGYDMVIMVVGSAAPHGPFGDQGSADSDAVSHVS
jgi:hypothetical protein